MSPSRLLAAPIVWRLSNKGDGADYASADVEAIRPAILALFGALGYDDIAVPDGLIAGVDVSVELTLYQETRQEAAP